MQNKSTSPTTGLTNGAKNKSSENQIDDIWRLTGKI